MLLGEPGSGKSSFLRHLALCLAGELRWRSGDAHAAECRLAAPARLVARRLRPGLHRDAQLLVTAVFPPLPVDGDTPVRPPDSDHLWRYLQTFHGAGLAGPGGELRGWFDRGRSDPAASMGWTRCPDAGRKERREQIRRLSAHCATLS